MKQSPFNYWLSAARPKTWPASIIPVLVACSLSSYQNQFQWIPALICFFFALLTQIVSNYLNDYFDFVKGSDRPDRLGPPRAVAQGWIQPKKMLMMSVKLIALACLMGLTLVYYAGWEIILVGIIVCIGAYAYSSGPYPLAYHGWGDVCVVIFYGIVPVGFTYYVQTLEWNWVVTVCGIAMGLVTTNILISNNYRDREQDKISGKNTSIVLLGESFGRWLYLFNGIIAVILCLFLWHEKLTWAALLPVLYLLPHLLTWQKMCRIREGKELNKILARSSINTVIFGLLLSAGILFCR